MGPRPRHRGNELGFGWAAVLPEHTLFRRANPMPANLSEPRGFSQQLPGDGDTVVIPDGDLSGQGFPARLLDASLEEISVLIPIALQTDPYVTIELTNPLQHRKLRLRGSVRALERLEDGQYRLDCALVTRFSPDDLRGLWRTPAWPTLCQ